MKIEIIKENDDGTVVVKKESVSEAESSISKLETANQEMFNKGYGQGQSKGKDEAVSTLASKLPFLKLDPADLDNSISAATKSYKQLEQGKIGESQKIEELQIQLTEKSSAYEKLEGDYNSFRTDTLINTTLKDIATNMKAVNVNQASVLFKNEFNVGLDGDSVVIKDPVTGQPFFDGQGNQMDMATVFEKKFKANNPHLFSANGNGGSGGGSGTGEVVTYADLKTTEEKNAYIKLHGMAAFQKLVDEHKN